MFFVLSKIFWTLAAPSHWLALLVVATAASLLFRWHRAAKLSAFLASALLLAGWLAVGPLMRDLENRYPRPPWPKHVDGILVLGAGFDSLLLRQRHAPGTNRGAYRLVEGLAAARQYPDAKLVFTGGSGALGGSEFPESDTARYVFTELGRDPQKIVLESRSRNTYENILFSKAIVKPKPGEVWLLVTSAMHMPRAIAVTHKLQWRMTAWPSDFITRPDTSGSLWDITGILAAADNLGLVDYAVHEQLGLIAYRLSGKAQ